MERRAARAGFSLIEALVVLAIGGMALAIVFGIGIRAGDAGFGLGRRAMDASDADVAISDVRAILRSVAIRPPQTFQAEADRPISGEAARLDVEVVMERATTCAPQGYAGRLTLSIEGEGPDQRLMCRAAGRSAELLDLRGPGAAFSYSTDGANWGPTYSNAPRGGADFGVRGQPEVVWIRVADARRDVIERASSGRPELWVRPSIDF